jgi:hypothetical protein
MRSMADRACDLFWPEWTLFISLLFAEGERSPQAQNKDMSLFCAASLKWLVNNKNNKMVLT